MWVASSPGPSPSGVGASAHPQAVLSDCTTVQSQVKVRKSITAGALYNNTETGRS